VTDEPKLPSAPPPRMLTLEEALARISEENERKLEEAFAKIRAWIESMAEPKH
jgi:hypothetical protein